MAQRRVLFARLAAPTQALQYSAHAALDPLTAEAELESEAAALEELGAICDGRGKLDLLRALAAASAQPLVALSHRPATLAAVREAGIANVCLEGLDGEEGLPVAVSVPTTPQQLAALPATAVLLCAAHTAEQRALELLAAGSDAEALPAEALAFARRSLKRATGGGGGALPTLADAVPLLLPAAAASEAAPAPKAATAWPMESHALPFPPLPSLHNALAAGPRGRASFATDSDGVAVLAAHRRCADDELHLVAALRPAARGLRAACHAWSADGCALVVGYGRSVVLYDAASLAELGSLRLYFDAAVVAAAGSLVAVAGVNGVELHRFPRDPAVPPIPILQSFSISSVAFSRGGDLLAVGALDGHVGVWRTDVFAGDRYPAAWHSALASGRVTDVGFSPDARWLHLCCWNGSVHVFDTASWAVPAALQPLAEAPEPLQPLTGAYGATFGVWSPNSAYLAVARGPRGCVDVVCAASGRLVAEELGPADRPSSANAELPYVISGLCAVEETGFAFADCDRRLHLVRWPGPGLLLSGGVGVGVGDVDVDVDVVGAELLPAPPDEPVPPLRLRCAWGDVECPLVADSDVREGRGAVRAWARGAVVAVGRALFSYAPGPAQWHHHSAALEVADLVCFGDCIAVSYAGGVGGVDVLQLPGLEALGSLPCSGRLVGGGDVVGVFSAAVGELWVWRGGGSGSGSGELERVPVPVPPGLQFSPVSLTAGGGVVVLHVDVGGEQWEVEGGRWSKSASS